MKCDAGLRMWLKICQALFSCYFFDKVVDIGYLDELVFLKVFRHVLILHAEPQKITVEIVELYSISIQNNFSVVINAGENRFLLQLICT